LAMAPARGAAGGERMYRTGPGVRKSGAARAGGRAEIRAGWRRSGRGRGRR